MRDLGPIEGVCGHFVAPDVMPLPIAHAIYHSIQPRDWQRGRFRATDLCTPPQLLHLKRTRWHELTAHATDFWAMATGTAIHAFLERFGKTEGYEVEQRGEVTLNGNTVTGTMDVTHPESGLIADYKTGGLYGEKPEWETQLNIYALMAPFEVRRLEVWAWNTKGFKVRGDQEFEVFPINLWPRPEAEARILALCAERDCEPRPCTDEERWVEKPWKVKKKTKAGAKKPERTVTAWQDKEEARRWLSEQSDGHTMWIEHEPGEPRRCATYCPVASVCAQFQGGA